MEIDDSPVAVPCARPKADALGGQPGPQQERGERQPARPVNAARPRGKLGRELLCLPPTTAASFMRRSRSRRIVALTVSPSAVLARRVHAAAHGAASGNSLTVTAASAQIGLGIVTICCGGCRRYGPAPALRLPSSVRFAHPVLHRQLEAMLPAKCHPVRAVPARGFPCTGTAEIAAHAPRRIDAASKTSKPCPSTPICGPTTPTAHRSAPARRTSRR